MLALAKQENLHLVWWQDLRCVLHTCTAGLGQVDHSHLENKDPDIGIVIVRIGIPAYRVGMPPVLTWLAAKVEVHCTCWAR